MSAFTNITELYANGRNPKVKGRDAEIRRLFLTLLRHEKPNVLLLGEAGVGKTTLIHHLAYLIANQMCPTSLFGFEVVSVNTNSLISGDGYRGVIEKKFEDMINTALNKKKCILFIDEFHTVQNLGRMSDGQTPGLANTLKPYLTRGDFRVIGATTTEEMKIITDKALLRRFSQQYVGEPDKDVLIDIIRTCFVKFIGELKITVEDHVPQQIYDLSLALPGINPDKCKDIVDIVVADAKMNESKTITQGSVSATFDLFYLQMQREKERDEKTIFIKAPDFPEENT